MRFFASGLFYESVSPHPQSIPLGPFQIFLNIRGDIHKSRCTTGINDTGQICHRYQRHRRQISHRCQQHRWQTMGTISGYRCLKVNLKAKMYIFVNSTIQRCPNKIIKIFLTEDFFICQRCSNGKSSIVEERILRFVFVP
jgi:hypothetical protein